MNKWICLFLIITASSVHGGPLREEITSDKLIRSTLRVSVKRSYQDYTDIHDDVRRLPSEPQKGTALLHEQLDGYFHDEAGIVLPGYSNTFKGGGVKGCIYSIDDKKFKNKLFISFPGTQTNFEWAKNFLEITHFDNNIQKSYHDDIANLYAHQGEQSFFTALHKHINSKRSNYKDLTNGNVPENLTEYEYYFTGHSRGGGLAFIAAIRFKEKLEGQNVKIPTDHVKVATFCTPRLTNAYSTQSKFISLLGYDNIVHFVRPSDLAPRFPFQFVENQGVQILLEPDAFWSIIQSHRIPEHEEVERSVDQYNKAKGIGWFYPIRYMFTLEPKPLLWGFGGVCFSLLLVKTNLGSYLSGELRDLYFRVVKYI